MPWCECHFFASLESETAPVISHADVAELVLMSTLESISPKAHRTVLTVTPVMHALS